MSTERIIPLFLTIREVAKILKWTRWKTQVWLEANGLLRSQKGYGVVSVAALKDAFPEVWEELCVMSDDVSEKT